MTVKNSRFLKLFFIHKKKIFILFLLGLFSSGFSLAAPYFSKLFIDKAFIDKDFGRFLNLAIAGAGIFLISALIEITRDIIKNKTAVKLRLGIADKFIKKIYSLDLEFFRSRSTGENIYRISDTETISNFIVQQCPSILLDMVKVPVILWISLYLDVRLTIFFLVLAPLFIVPNLYLRSKLKPLYEKIWNHGAELSRIVYEAFSKILIIKAFGLESHQRRAYIRALINNIRWKVKSFRWSAISSLSFSFLSKAVYGITALYGGWLIIKGRMSIGSYAAIMLYLTQLGGLFISLGDRLGYFIQETVSFDKFFEIMDIEPGIKDFHDAKILKSVKGDIRFKGVSFGYQKEKAIFRELDLNIPSNIWAGIAGPSGCGKTTLINLVLRLYEPWQGSIFLDGLDLRMIRLDSLKGRIAIAAQEPFLFNVSIRENIGYGIKDISRDKIEEAARAAFVHDFIEQLPRGYETLIGEDACRLSQGLKQRIALARAIAREPGLLILDEATSSVDLLTENRIFQALRDKRHGLSTIIISHRLSSIKDADRIYFLESGKIIEGTHSRLLSESGLYRDFFDEKK